MADQKLTELARATAANNADLMYIVQSNASKRIAVSSLVSSIAVLVNSSYATIAYVSDALIPYATKASVTAALTSYTTNANLTSTLSLYATDIELAAAITTSNAALTATLLSYASNANLTATLLSYATNANLTSTLASYTTNVNLTSILASYTTNVNLTSTLAAFTVSKLQYSSLTVQLDSSGSVTFPTDSRIRNGYPGSFGSSGDGSSWFVTPPSQPGGVVSANGEQYIQINNGVHVEIGTNYTSSSGNAWLFDQSGRTIFPIGVTLSAARGSDTVNFTTGFNKFFQIETTTTSTSKLWNFSPQGIATWPVPAYVPTTSTSTGTTGQVTWDSGYIYVCIASDTWRRTALTTW
jgi:hypothetical protein